MTNPVLGVNLLNKTNTITWLRDKGVYVALVLLFIFNFLFTNHFASVNTLLIQLVQVSPVVILSLGMALVIGTEGIDLSVGSVMAFASAVVSLMAGSGWIVALASALVAGALAGLLSGFLVAFVKVQPIVATLALFVGLRALGQMLVGGKLVQIDNPTLLGIGHGHVAGIPTQIILAVIIFALLGILIKRTNFGKYLLAVGSNPIASFLSGHPVRRTIMIVYIISGVLAALAGIIETSRLSTGDPSNIGLLKELDAITAVVVGGTPLSGGKVKLIGTVAGAILMQLIAATFIMNNLPNTYAQIVEAVIILLAVYIQLGKGGS